MRKVLLAVIIGAGFLELNSVAQHQPAQEAGLGEPNIHSHLMSKMSRAMASQQEVANLTDDLVKSFAALRSESDPMTLNAEIDAHEALLKQLQSTVQGQSRMMTAMQRMIEGQMVRKKMMTGDSGEHAPKK